MREPGQIIHLCSCCGCEIAVEGMCVECNTAFWESLMMEELDAALAHSPLEPARG